MHERLRRSLTIVIAVPIAAMAFPARAAFVDDAALAQGPLDLKRFVANKRSAGGPIHISVVTYGTWKPKLLHVDGPNRIYVLFNPDRSGDAASSARSSSGTGFCGCASPGRRGRS